MRRKWTRWVAIGISIVLSSMVYTMMSYSLSGIEIPTEEFLEQTNQEDFSIEIIGRLMPDEMVDPAYTTFLMRNITILEDIKDIDPKTFDRLIDKRINSFETAYPSYRLELRSTKLTTTVMNNIRHKILFVKNAKLINLTYLENGRWPINDDEIAINREYARRNDYSIGDHFDVNGDTYTITGFILIPDYTFPMFDKTFNVDVGLQTYALVNDRRYEELDYPENFRLSGIYPKKIDTNLFTRDVVNTYRDKSELMYIRSIVATDYSLRSGAIYDELVQGKVMAVGFGIFLSMISVIILSVIIAHQLSVERGQIGILKALGYNQWQIAWPYFVSVNLFGFILLLIGYLFGWMMADPMKQLYLDFYLLPSLPIVQTWGTFLTGILVPLIVFAIFSLSVIVQMLKKRALDLLHPMESQSVSRLSRFVNHFFSESPIQRKYKIIHALNNARNFLVFFMGILTATLLFNFAFMMEGTMQRMTIGYLNQVKFNYQVYVDLTKGTPTLREGEEPFLSDPYAMIDDLSVTVIGLDADSKLYALIDSEGKEITPRLTDGFIISKRLNLKKDINLGDAIDLEVGGQTLTQTVIGISDEYTEDLVYLDRETLSLILTNQKSKDFFIGFYSSNEPEADRYSTILVKSDMLQQAKAMQGFGKLVETAMTVGSTVIAFCILYVLTAMTVDENTYAISLFKAIGYRKGEINRMILNSYLIYAIISYLISLPIALLLIQIVLDIFVIEYGILLPLSFNWLNGLLGLCFVIVLFYIGTWHSRRSIERISLQEVMKQYRE